MSDNFALAFLGSAALTPTGRTLRGPSGSLVRSYGVIKNVSVWHKDVKASLDFHVFKVPNFDSLSVIPLISRASVLLFALIAFLSILPWHLLGNPKEDLTMEYERL
jgi:hypothetical protein